MDFAKSRGVVDLVIDGVNFFPRILADIESARSSVHVSEFEFRPGRIGDQFAVLLKKKAAQGVEVRLIVDRLGSAVDTASRRLMAELAAAGVQIVQNDTLGLHRRGLLGGHRQTVAWRFDELARADHRKLFVIDGCVGWVGSAGIADHFFDGRFHDVYVRTEGEVVAYLQTIFLASFRFLGGPLPEDPGWIASCYPPATNPGTTPIAVLHNAPRAGLLANTDAIADLIDTARARIDIVCPYTADRGMLQRLMSAARRGVSVRFLAPARSGSWATAWAFAHYIPGLLASGIDVWLNAAFPHAKVILADDRVLIGSTNLDAWALYRNWELGLLIDDAAVTQRVRAELFDRDIDRATQATAEVHPVARARNAAFAAIGPLI